MKKIVVATALVAVLTMIAACGEDEKRLSAEEFLKQGNAICSAGNKVLDDAGTEFFGSGEEPTEEQMTTFVNDVLAPNVQDQIDGIKALRAPADLEDDVDQMLSDAQTAVDKFKDDPVAVFSSEEDPFADVNVQAEAIGLTACSGDDE